MACKKILPKNFSIEIDVKKNIPDGAGLGGGSSNAATILIAINDLCSLNLSKKELANIGAHLGADVPFFIHNNLVIVEGIGDKIMPIDLAPLKLLLCCPSLKISTKDIFTSYKLTNKSKELKITALSNYEDLIDELGNDLEAFVRQKNSTIDDLLSYLQKFGVAKLTGTGSGCFLILNETINLDEVKQNLPKNVRIYEVSSVNYNIAYDAQH
jgi:4-diphosphocytidyl-2-C-methyl-D-erythritol kinase